MAAFKDELSVDAIDQIASAVHHADPAFARSDFVAAALGGLEELELKGRVAHIMACLREFMVGDWGQQLAVLQAALAAGPTPALPAGPPDQLEQPAGLRGFIAWPLIDYVSAYGRDQVELSFPALAQMTAWFTSEFAVRPFILDDASARLNDMLAWTQHPSDHVRRLASEGSRPVLPWGIGLPELKQDPSLSVDILAALREDRSSYVQRSVANHLNDHSKLHADFVLDRCEEWGGTRLPWLRHALRGLVKAGHPRVWPLLGFDPDPPVRAALQSGQSSVRRGGEWKFKVELTNTSAHEIKLVLDYQMHFVRARGPRSAKVFKLRELRLAPGEARLIEKAHSFKPVTTRRDYPGVHKLVLQINGRQGEALEFELLD